MGWTKMKLALVVVLVVSNLILCGGILSLYRSAEYIPEESRDRIVQILAEDGITLQPTAVDWKKQDLLIYEGSLGENYYTETAERLSRSAASRSFTTPTGYIMTMENGDRLVFYGGFGVRYERADSPQIPTLQELDRDSLRELTTGQRRFLEKIVAAFLKDAEETETESKSVRISIATEFCGEDANGIQYCVVRQMLRETPLTTSSSLIAVFDGVVIGMSGEWCFARPETKYSAQLSDQLHILYNIRNMIALEEENPLENREITSLSLGYVSYFRADSDQYYLIPAWNAEFASGTKYTINAVDDSLYTE